jgi:hypothetical protein
LIGATPSSFKRLGKLCVIESIVHCSAVGAPGTKVYQPLRNKLFRSMERGLVRLARASIKSNKPKCGESDSCHARIARGNPVHKGSFPLAVDPANLAAKLARQPFDHRRIMLSSLALDFYSFPTQDSGLTPGTTLEAG